MTPKSADKDTPVRIRDVDDLIGPAVADTIDQLTLQPEDHAAAQLATRYAAAIDAAEDTRAALDHLGPKLLAVLEQLGATPKARATLTKGAAGRGGQSELAKLRAAR
jgi:hypothetical protein